MTPAVKVQVEDAYGNLITTNTDSIDLSVSGGATLLGTHPKNAVAGVATFSNLSIQLAGVSYTLTASDGAITKVSTTFDITPAATSQFDVSGFPSPTTIGTAGTVIVTAQDQFGNTTPGYVGTIKFTSSDASATLPPNYTFVAGDNGVHTFTNGVTFNAAGTWNIVVKQGALAGSQTGIVVS